MKQKGIGSFFARKGESKPMQAASNNDISAGTKQSEKTIPNKKTLKVKDASAANKGSSEELEDNIGLAASVPSDNKENGDRIKSPKQSILESSQNEDEVSSFGKTPRKKRRIVVDSDQDNDDSIAAPASLASSPIAVDQHDRDEDSQPNSEMADCANILTEIDENDSTPERMKAHSTKKSGQTKSSSSKTKISSKRDMTISNYDPNVAATWADGQDVPFAALADIFAVLEGESGRLAKIEALSDFFRSVIVKSPDDLLACVYLSINEIAPSFEGIELGVGEQSVTKAMSSALGLSKSKLKAESTKHGDLGIVAMLNHGKQKRLFNPKPLSAKSYFTQLKKLAALKGNLEKEAFLVKIFLACGKNELKYAVRAMIGKMRTGCSSITVLTALARALVLTPPSKRDQKEFAALDKEDLMEKLDEAQAILRRVWVELPIWDRIIPAVIEYGVNELTTHCSLTPGVPVKAMLANPAKGIEAITTVFGDEKVTVEWKYDGERAQIHLLPDKTIKIFSRNSEDNTEKYPDLISVLPSVFNDDVRSAILDCEVVAYNPQDRKILPFQVLSKRKRKDVKEEDVEVSVCMFAFDMIYHNDQHLLNEPLEERRKHLHASTREVESRFQHAVYHDLDHIDEVQPFLDEAIDNNCEGLMVKTLRHDATYEPDKRSHSWLKLKKDYLDTTGDSFDLVPIAAYRGKGKRAGWYGAFLLACYDPDEEVYQSVCKVGTGFSDEMLTKFAADLPVIERMPLNYMTPTKWSEKDQPDVWFHASQVWEIKAADLSISPVHKAAVGLVDEDKGIALRFPRFERIREDKTPEDATSASQVASMYLAQKQIA